MPVNQPYNTTVNSSQVKTTTTPSGPVDNLSNAFANKSAFGWISESISSTVDNIGASAQKLKSEIGTNLMNVGNSIKTSIEKAEMMGETIMFGTNSDIGKKIPESRNSKAKDTNPNTTINKAKSQSIDIEYPLNENTHKYKFMMHVSQYQRPNPLVVATPKSLFTITLPLPRELIDNLTLEVHDKNLDPLVGAVANELTSNRNGITDIPNGNRDHRSGGVGLGMIAAYQGLQGFAFSDTIIAAGEQILGAIPNPHPSMMFSGVRLRNHTFSWRFTPTSSQEAAQLTTLIHRLKATSLPKYSGGDVNILQYPFMVFPEFIPDTLQNKMYKFKNCLIESVNVQYAAHGIPAFFIDGQPQSIEMTISLKEIEYLLSDDYDSDVSAANIGSVETFSNKADELLSNFKARNLGQYKDDETP